MKNKIKKKFLVLFLALSFLCGFAVYAEETQTISLPASETVPTDLILAGETVDVGSDVLGDVILAGGNISFSGDAEGDILLLGGNARVSGNSVGDIRVVGGNVTIDGIVEKNVTILGGSVIVEEGSIIKGNLYVAAGNVELRGTVEGNAKAYGSQIVFAGAVSGDADFRADKIIARGDAVIEGGLVYAASTDILLDENIVRGGVSRVPFENYINGYQKKAEDAKFGVELWQLLSLFIVGFIFFKLFRRQSEKLIGKIERKEIWNKIAYGFIVLVFNPIVIFVSFLTLVGIPLALMILFSYIILLIAAAVLSPVIVGRLLNGKFNFYKDSDKNLWIDFIAGYLLMQIIGVVPFFGDLALFLLFLFSYGRVTNYVYGEIRNNK
ncbi:MAG: hypothetical protein PHI66_03025 [Candidatus Pacebacteria bacterium]|nr:hypothetical protein [Candidatus Paceibacterota bacterium]